MRRGAHPSPLPEVLDQHADMGGPVTIAGEAGQTDALVGDRRHVDD